MTTTNTPADQIKVLETVDNFIVYAIGSNVYQIEVSQDDLEFVFGSDTLTSENWSAGTSYIDTVPAIASLKEVDASDYLLLITSLQANAEDITDSYEGPINDMELEICRIAKMSTQEDVKRALWSLMLTSRELKMD